MLPVAVYLTVGGVCGLVGVAATGMFCVFSGLHCAMQIQNNQLCIKYKKNVFLAVITAAIAGTGTNLLVIILFIN